ncbi:MAG: hypothetical protein M3033_16775 [Acidobacteriota bacterium]|nr:hypothetical protein [Acidobacteriota bacterium]
MKIQLNRTGGFFSGLALNVKLDSETLDKKKTSELKEILKPVEEFNKSEADKKDATERTNSKTESRSASIPADEFQYDLTITDAGKTVELKTSDSSASPEMIRLIDWLIANGAS